MTAYQEDVNSRQKRAGHNQSLLREVNERVKDIKTCAGALSVGT